MAESKFAPGTKVYKQYGHWGAWEEDYVDKVYKTGNFVLKGESGQWRPYGERSADKAGSRDRWSHHSLRLADAEMEALVANERAEKVRRKRHHNLIRTLEKTPATKLTDEILTELEEAIKKLHPEEQSDA